MIIQGENSKRRRFMEIVLTAFGWLFLLVFLYVLGTTMKWTPSGKLYSLTLANANIIIFIGISVVAMSFIGLILWGEYNKRRFGQLQRRTFPESTTLNEMADYYSLKTDEVLQLQEKKYVER